MNIKNFGLLDLKYYLFKNSDGRVNHITLGAPRNFFAMIIKGHATFTSSEGEVSLYPGELLYIPKGLVYTSKWFGEGECHFYSLGFTFRHFSENARFALQKLTVTQLANAGLDKPFFEAALGDEWQSLALFYYLYGKAAPHLLPRTKVAHASEISPALRFMEEDPAGEFDVPRLAKLCGLGESRFYECFRAATGCTPMEYKNILRARLAVELLTGTDMKVEEIAARLSCASPSYLRRILAATVGKTPKEIRREKISL